MNRAAVSLDIARRRRMAPIHDGIALAICATFGLAAALTGGIGGWFLAAVGAVACIQILRDFGKLPPLGPGRKAIMDRSRARWAEADRRIS